MGQKLPQISGKEMLKILSKIGIVGVRQRGSHVQMKGEHKGEMRYTTVPIHEKQLPIGTILGILEDCGITREEFFEMLK